MPGLFIYTLVLIVVVICIIKYIAASKEKRENARLQAQIEIERKEAARALELREKAKAAEYEKALIKHGIERNLCIMRESQELVANSKNVDVALNRIATMRHCAVELSEYHKKAYINASNDILRIAKMTDVEYTSIVWQVIKRTFSSTVEDSKQLKTERGRLNRITSYFDKLNELSALIPEEIHSDIYKLASKHGIEFQFQSTDNPQSSESADNAN